MNPPIVIAAFGTTSKARTVYEKADARFKARFAGHDIKWAFTSRMIRHRLKNRNISAASPAEVVSDLSSQGHPWAVVQSFNMICGHEFYRLIDEVGQTPCRISMGHSLLCSPEDHRNTARALAPIFAENGHEAVVLVGHGTDHCIWTVYPAFYQLLKEMYGKRVYGGMVEKGYPGRDVIVEKVKTAGFKRVRLIPFMLVAGVHFKEDLAGPDDSWKTAFEDQGIEVVLESEGLGSRTAIIDIFSDHIQSAISVIPDSDTMSGTLAAGGEGVAS